MNYWMRMLLEGANFAVAGEGGGDQGGAGGSGGSAEGGAGGDGGDGNGQQSGATLGADGKPIANGGDNSGAKDGGAGDGQGADGQAAVEYVADPTKTPEENATLKAAHDAKVVEDKERAEFFGAPEKYADLKVPEGVTLDQDAADGLFALGKKLGLSQKAIDGIIDLQKGVYERSAETAKTEWQNTLKGWTDTVKADPEIGGAAYDKNMGLAAQARNTFGSKEFNAWLDETQLGSQPEFVRFMVSVGAAMGEGKAVGGGRANTQEDAGTILYDNPTSKLT